MLKSLLSHAFSTGSLVLHCESINGLFFSFFPEFTHFGLGFEMTHG